ncbi:MAG: hypothetical protein ACFFD7_12960 [Candidatus Thorarchaeota archaeon]
MTLNFIPNVLGKTRSLYLTDFIYSNEIQGTGFENGQGKLNEVSYEATAYSLEILRSYGKSAHDISTLQTNLEDVIDNMFSRDSVNLYDLYFVLKSLFIIDDDYPIEENLKERIFQYLNDSEQVGGGFSFVNTTMVPTLSSTYFCVQIHTLLAPMKTLQNLTLHRDWILSNNNSDGGYGNISSTILTTYYAVSLLDTLTSVNDLTNKELTLSYLNSFYVSNPSDTDRVGGFLPDLTSKSPLLSSTFYCVTSISLINESLLNPTQINKWVLSRQYFKDGGFADLTEGDDQLSSSVFGSYFAIKTLKSFDPSLLILAVDIWNVEFNYWILIILMGGIGLIAIIGVVIWRRRRI